MNSKLLKKKSALIFSAVFAILIVGCVFLNAFLVKPAVAKSGNNVDSSATETRENFLPDDSLADTAVSFDDDWSESRKSRSGA